MIDVPDQGPPDDAACKRPATWTRAYAPPETSVPPVPASAVGSAVNSAAKRL